MSRDVIAVIAVFDQRGPAAVIFCVRKARNQHPTGQGIRAVRTNRAASGFREIVDRFHVSRFRRISVHVKNKHSAVIKTCNPELVAVVGESAVVRLVAALDRRATDDFAKARRARFYVDGDKFIRAVSETFDAKCPDIDELFLTFDAGEIR
jgi:hypothetical protein